MKLALSLPWNHSYVPSSLLMSLWASDIPKGTLLARAASQDVTHARNQTIKLALEWGADEILLLDADQRIPKDVLARLRSHGKNIVGCLTPVRRPPYHWSIFNYLPGIGKYINGSAHTPLQEVGATGIGCMLVKSEVFRSIPHPWFKREFSADGCEMEKSDDVWFCEAARAAGYRIYVDTTLESPHEHEITLCAETLGREVKHMEVFA